MPSDVPAVAAAVRVLERLAFDWPDPVSPGALVSELGLNRSTCYNILATLQNSGWALSLGERGGWTLGPRLLALTSHRDDMVVVIGQQEIEELSRRIPFVVFYAQQDGTGNYVVLAKAERRQGVRVTVNVGDVFDFSAPALMQAVGAWRPQAEFDRMARRHGIKQFTELTVVDLAAIHQRLQRVRSRGFSTSLRQFDMAQGAVAAPVFDRRGTVSSAICALGFSSDLHEDNVFEVGRQVQACAARITSRIGGEFPSTGDVDAAKTGS